MKTGTQGYRININYLKGGRCAALFKILKNEKKL